MAHANPEFALGLMRHEAGPVSAQVRDLPTFSDLRAKMRAIEITISDHHNGFGREPTEEELAIWDAWCAGRRRIRQRRRQEAATPTSFAGPRAGGMHAGAKVGETFVPPVPRGEGRRQRFAQS